MRPEQGRIALQAVMGSHAYGMAHSESDEDRKGVYVASTVALAGLYPPTETIVRTNPDFEYHEVGKFIRLALKCNPTVLEQLFLPVDYYEELNVWGNLLVEHRSIFLSRKKVAGAFGGYALDQIKRLQRRGDGSFSSDVRKRHEKHARHCFRLFAQGKQLLETGRLEVKVADPEKLFELGRLPEDKLVAAFEAEDAAFGAAYEASKLPEQPDGMKAAEILAIIRANNL